MMSHDRRTRIPARRFRAHRRRRGRGILRTGALVYHIDDHAVSVLTGLYREILPAGGVLLDLMSSWVSHLPPDIDYAEVIGHGMNAEELAANPRLKRWFVQDLNRDTMFPLADNSVDAAMICVSIQYLQQPLAVLREAARVLRPGGPIVISFSNRCFWTKAVAIWRGSTTRATPASSSSISNAPGLGRSRRAASARGSRTSRTRCTPSSAEHLDRLGTNRERPI
jgi:SAM-dependent methyltransferase